MANLGSLGILRILEDFSTDHINTAAANGVGWLVSSDAGDTAFARAAAAARGLHCAGATAATDDNLIELAFDTLGFYGQNAFLSLEVLFQLDVVTTVAFNIGFNDDQLEDSNTLPVELATTTFTANAAEFIGLVFDVDATNDDLHVNWVDDTVLASNAIADLRMSGGVPIAGQWGSYRVELQDRGSGLGVRATFSYVDNSGRSFEKSRNTTLDRDAALTPYIGVENRAAVIHNAYVKYILVEHSIG